VKDGSTMNHSPSSANSHPKSNTDRILKLLGALVVLWAGAKIIGWLLSPGLILLAVALWLVVRSQRKAQKPAKVAHFSSAPSASWQPQPQYGTDPSGSHVRHSINPAWQGQPHVQAMHMPQYAQPQYVQPQYVQPQYAQPQYGQQPPQYAYQTPAAKILDHRTQAEREIEDFVERSWPNV
jgi:hypothetical protein